MQICPSCGEENPDRFRLCGFCGTALTPETPAEQVRKTVTAIFTDLKGSTTLGETLDPEAIREVLNVYFNEMRAVVESHGGKVEKYIGDAIVAVFGLPRAHEDDALRAVRAAADMQRALARVNESIEASYGVRLETRTGVNTGEVVAGDVSAEQHLITGDTMNTAARLEAAAPPMETLISDSTYRLVKDAVEIEAVEPLSLKGKAEPVPAYLLLSVRREEGYARRLDAPLVGRSEELLVLLDTLDRAVTQRRAQLVTVFGPAGVGKSRLLREFVAGAGPHATVLAGRCLSYGDGITFFPLAEMMRGAAGIENDDPLEVARSKLASLVGPSNADVADRVGAAIGLSTAVFSTDETFWGARRCLEILAERGPVVALIDDIHWAEQTFLELLEHVLDAAGSPIVLACSSRPDLLEERPDWLEGRVDSRRVVLSPLSDDESAHIVENLLGTAELDLAVRERIVDAAEGNPLFVEQLLSMLIDEGILAMDERGGWILVSDIGSFAIPPTIGALLTARLDRLGSTERAVVERGAVIGQIFFRGAVEELAPDAVRPLVGSGLQTLVRKELIRPHESTFAGQESYRFFHGLIRDAAYQGLLKRTRAELHERFVDWAERVAPERVTEYEEILGYHLEQAHQIRVGLAPPDEHTNHIGLRGGSYLERAGRRALGRGDMPAAANLLRRAAGLLPEDDARRAKLLLYAGEALMETGEFTQADNALTSAIRAAHILGERGVETTAHIVRVQLHLASEMEGSDEALVLKEVADAVPVLEELGDHEGLTRASRLLTYVHFRNAQYGAAEAAALDMIEHARHAGDRVMQTRVLGSLAVCALYGPTPAGKAIERCEALLEETRTDRKAQALILCALAHLRAMRGDFEQARDLYRGSRATLEELGWKLYAALTSLDSGPVEMLAGDPVAAERELRRDYEVLDQMGDRYYISTTAGLLAEALFQQERLDEAEAFSATCQQTAADDDPTSMTLWRCVRGKVLAARGQFAEAEVLVQAGVEIIHGTDDVDSQGNALLDLAEVLSLAGRRDEAAGAVERAAARFEAKGNTVSEGHARRLLQELAPAASPQAPGFPTRS